MKKYIAFSLGNIEFLSNTGLPFGMPEQQVSRFQRLRHCYVPEHFSALKTEHSQWIRQYIEDQSPPVPGRPPRKRRTQTLLDTLRDTHIFLPLDSTALTFAAAQKLRYKIPADLIDGPSFYATIKRALAGHAAWTSSIDGRDLGWSENWLVFDGDPVTFLFRAAYLAQALIPALKSTAEEIICLERDTPSILPAFSPNELAQSIWAAAMPDRIKRLLHPGTPFPEYTLENLEKQDHSVMQDALVVGLHEISLFRHKRMLQATRNQSNRPLVLALTQCALDSRTSAAALAGQEIQEGYATIVIPAFSGTVPNFPRAVTHRLQESLAGHFPYVEAMPVFFEELAATRFYNLEQMYSTLLSLWQEHRPALCIGENTLVGEYAIPLLAARALGIPSLSVPHGALSCPQDYANFSVPATCHCYCTPLELEAWKPVIEKSSEAVCLQEFDMDTSYASSNSISYFFPENKHVLLVALGAPIWNSSLLYGAYPKAVVAWLKATAAVPEDLQDQVLVLYKLHPGFSDYGILARAGIQQKRILPLDSSLPELMPHLSILISCEYISSPTLVAMKQGIPVIHCIENTAVEAKFHPPAHLALAQGGLLVSTPDALWRQIRSLTTPNGTRETVLAQQNNFLNRNIVPPVAGWGECLERTRQRRG